MDHFNSLCQEIYKIIVINAHKNNKSVCLGCVSAYAQVRLSVLEEQRPHAADLALLFNEDLKVLVDDGDG